MKYPLLLRKRNDEVITLVVPPFDNKHTKVTKVAQEHRRATLASIKRIISATKTGSANDKLLFCQERLRQSTIIRNGKDHYEFNVRIKSYPERATLERMDLSNAQLKYFLMLLRPDGVFISLDCFDEVGTRRFLLIAQQIGEQRCQLGAIKRLGEIFVMTAAIGAKLSTRLLVQIRHHLKVPFDKGVVTSARNQEKLEYLVHRFHL